MKHLAGSPIQRAVAIFSAVLLPLSVGFAQAPAGDLPAAPPGAQQAAPLLSPDELSNLVAPIALYPDPLLGQVLAASTYPLEIAEAGQWLQQNNRLQGAQLMDAARQQNWDPSVQALVALPDALRLLSNDIRWTTALGNAFLAQQADVMSAVQRMRAQARANGRLTTTPQQVVTTSNQGDQSAIEIQPADPQVIYVPVYNLAYVWGPPVWGAYPDLWYPPGFGFGFGFGPGIFIGGFFPGWGGWGGWGWGCGWFGGGLFVNAGFFNHYGFRGGFGGGFGRPGFAGRGAWAHDPGHRMGVPYPNRTVAGRFNSTRFNGSAANGGQFRGAGRTSASPVNANRFTGGQGGSAQSNGWQRFSGQNRAATNGSAGFSRQASPNIGGGLSREGSSQGFRAPAQNYRGSNSTPGYRGGSSYSASNRGFPAPRSYTAPSGNFSGQRSYSAPSRSFSAPRSYSAPSRSYSAPRSFSAPRSSGGGSGFSGGHAGSSGGGHASGGGGGRRR